MKKQSSLALILILYLCAATFGQQPQPQPVPRQKPDSSSEDEVVRITTNLVQIDAMVTDKKGKQVTDLRPEDFEILEDGRPQRITSFSYITLDSAPAARPVPPVDKNGPPVPPVRLRPEQVRRTIALVVDDLGVSFESAYFVRRALKKFVDEQMQPGDMVAVLRTTAGIGALQQFTSDKRQLYSAIERVRGSLIGRGQTSVFGPLDSTDPEGGNAAEEELNDFREELFAVGTLGALNYIVRGLREMPGRKAVVLISSSLPIFNSGGRNERLLDALRHLIDLSNRASVVIYTMDPRGLQVFGLTAADFTSGASIEDIERRLSDPRQDYFESQNGLNYLAQQTGGIFIHDTNDLSAGFSRILEDQKGYYLIGYRPDESTFDPLTGRRSFHKLAVKVDRPGLRVRSRNGFYGITDEQAHPMRRNREEQLVGALVSPFNSGDIHMRLTSLFGSDQRAGSFMRSMLYIDPHDLSFTKELDGSHKVNLDIVAITFGDNGRAVDQVNRTFTISLKDQAYQRLLERGLTYMLNVPVKKAGAYHLRLAVRDQASERIGSASQFIEIPNLDKNRLALSGVILGGIDPAAAKVKPVDEAATPAAATAPTPQGANQTESAADIYDPQASPAVRRLRRGMILEYGYVIYNAQTDHATNRPQLLTQVRLFRDGQQVFAGKELPFNPVNQPDMKRLIAGGRVRVGSDLIPGEYILQVIVIDQLAKEKYRTATQWTDFEIVNGE
jgi:VWFA-related protein